MTKQTHFTIPASLIPQFEAWGKLTAQLFHQLNRYIEPVAADQAWYGRAPWQQWEQEADADIAAGRVKQFSNVDALLADLEG